MSLIDVDPDQARKVLGCQGELCPVLPAFIVAFVCGGAAEAEGKTDDETENSKEKLVDANCTVLASC